VLDATCAPADIAYPQDIKLLSDAREKLEGIIDKLHDPSVGKKPRTYRRCARKEYLNFVKSKARTAKKRRKAIRKQLNYVKRNIGYVEKYISEGKELSEKDVALFGVIKQVYDQQLYMWMLKKQSVDNRIVSIYQPHVRPIVRGKAKAKTEFGAKFEISVVNGFVRLEKLSWDAYNESTSLKQTIERYRKIHGHYPARILADKLYRNRENLKFCKERGIRLSGPALGRPKKDAPVDKSIEYNDSCDRNIIEGKFGESKLAYGLEKVRAKLKETSEAVIQMALISMNLARLLRTSS
jgi:hypothetical protein